MARRTSKPNKLTRQENAIYQHQALLESAIQSVGSVGFNESSVSRITEAAGVAQGTLYYYFGSYQALLSQLLPTEGTRLFKALREHVDTPAGFFAEERRRFEALFRYLEKRPFILRLLIEAEVAAPESFFNYMSELGQRYVPVYKRAQQNGEMRSVTAREVQVLSETLAGCRAHMVLKVRAHFPNSPEHLHKFERHAIETYIKFLQHGIGSGSVPATRQKRRSAALPASQRIASLPPVLDTRATIYENAGPEIAAVGFADTLVKGVAARARISIGAFYSLFDGREEFLSALLLYARRQVTRHIAAATAGSKSFAEMEVRSIQAVFELFKQKPWLTRLAAEAAVWKPDEYRHHFTVISRGYRRQIRAAQARGEFSMYTDEEIEPLSVILTSAPRFLGARLSRDPAGVFPNWVAKSYINLVCCGLALNKKQ